MNSVKIDLQNPVEIAGTKVAELTMRPPKVRDMIAANKGSKDPIELETTLFANLCQIPPSTLEELDMRDYKKLQDAYSGFLS